MNKNLTKPTANTKTTLSKKLSWLLRHGAVKEGLHIQDNGFIKVEDILQHHNYKNSYSLELLKQIVDSDVKQRYTLRVNAVSGGYEIRANQGHTLKDIKDDKCLKPILTADEVPIAVHGTYFRHLPAIRRRFKKNV